MSSIELYKAAKMVKILRDLIFRSDLRKLQDKSFGYKVKYFWRKGWEEIPELMVLIPPSIVGILGSVWLLFIQNEERKKLPRYFNDITIFRPNDPRASRIRTDDKISVERLH